MSIAGQSNYDSWKTESPYEETPSQIKLGTDLNDQELITSGIRSALAQATQRPAITATYTPGKDFSGSVVLEVQTKGESDREAIRALYVELSYLLTGLLEQTI